MPSRVRIRRCFMSTVLYWASVLSIRCMSPRGYRCSPAKEYLGACHWHATRNMGLVKKHSAACLLGFAAAQLVKGRRVRRSASCRSSKMPPCPPPHAKCKTLTSLPAAPRAVKAPGNMATWLHGLHVCKSGSVPRRAPRTPRGQDPQRLKNGRQRAFGSTHHLWETLAQPGWVYHPSHRVLWATGIEKEPTQDEVAEGQQPRPRTTYLPALILVQDSANRQTKFSTRLCCL